MGKSENNSPLYIESRYLLRTYKKFGFQKTIALFSSIAFGLGTLVIVPINILMGGKILTGLAVNLVICTTFIPYHLYQVLRLLVDMDSLRLEMYEKSIHDELTNVYNRRYFFEAAGVLEDKASNIPPNTSVLLMDIDNFKTINDTYGHRVGDQALKLLTEQCAAILRSSDVFARYGGDEFICLLPQTDTEQAREVANRIGECTLNIRIEESKDVVLHNSIGIATSTTETSMNDLIIAADQALYKAKQGGRNRIESHKTPQ